MGKNIDGESSKSKTVTKKNDEVLTKVIIRRLPPSLHKDLLLEKLNELFPEGLPDHDYFRFCGSDLSFSPVPFSRAYINFKHPKDILNFKEKLDGYVFTDGKGGNYPVVVEFAPFQGVPKKTRRRKDIKSGTIEKDADYLAFLETLQQEVEPLPSAEVYLEQQEANKQSMKDAKVTTPLIEFLKMKKTSGKSRTSSQRPSSSNSNDKKRKPPKEAGKAGTKNTFPEKSGRSQNSSDSSKKGSDRKTEEFKGPRKFVREENERKHTTGGRGNENKNEKSKEKGQSEEKEKTARKDRPSSGKSYKDSRPQDDSQRPGSRPSSSYRQPRRGTKDDGRAKADVGKTRSESRPSSAAESTGEKSEERRSHKQQEQDNRERVRNKDRPAQAIYQPRSRPRAAGPDETTGKGSGRQTAKEHGKGSRENPARDRDNSQRGRDNSARDRDHRENNRRQNNRDSQKMPGKSEDISKE